MLDFLEDLFALIVTLVEYVFVFTALLFGFNIDENINIEPEREDTDVQIPQIDPAGNENMLPTSSQELDMKSFISTDEDLFGEIYDTLDALVVEIKDLNMEATEESIACDDEIASINKKLKYLLESMDESDIEETFANTLFFELTELALYVGINLILSDPMELYLRLINIRNSNYKRQLEGLPSIPEDLELPELSQLEFSMEMDNSSCIPYMLEYDAETINNLIKNEVLNFSPELIYDEDFDEDYDEDFEHFLSSSSHEE